MLAFSENFLGVEYACYAFSAESYFLFASAFAKALGCFDCVGFVFLSVVWELSLDTKAR